MAKYLIPYIIEGEIEVEAEDTDDAQAKFFNYSISELAEMGSMEQLDQPMTLEEINKRAERYGIASVPLTGDGS